jgi:glyoxylase-like metal-dependent hydrolase (beta-lactamase superfamily II)
MISVATLAILPSQLHASSGSVTFTPGVLPDKWLTGGPDCSELPQDFQVHRYNDNLYILREAGCVHHEKPFLFLLFGQNKALLLDTGAGPNTDPETGREPNVRGAVDFVINAWLKKNNRQSIPLVIVHLHSHFDHIWGDFQFANRPETTLVPPGSVQALKTFFGITNWPEQIVPYDLGRRVVDIIPTPGHDDTELAIYDRQTGILLTGDTLYPGRLYINGSADEFQASIQRMVTFTENKVVTHVIGTHIERKAPYLDYPIYEHYQPIEVDLQMGRDSLLELLEATKLRDKNGKIVQKIYRDFTICGSYPNCNPINK